MTDYKTVLKHLCSIMTVSGCEKNAADAISSVYGSCFNSVMTDPARNIILVKKCTSLREKSAPKLILDAHIDQVGMMVTGITDTGLLKIASVGGIDRQILPTAGAKVYAREVMEGIFVTSGSTDAKDMKTPEWDDIFVDIGCTATRARELVKPGDIVTYNSKPLELLCNRITGSAFDDKACAAALLCAVCDTPSDSLAFDTYITLSSGEEVGGGGALNAAYSLVPDAAVITDVNFAKTPGVPEDESGSLGGGPMISVSAVTDRVLTKMILDTAEREKIPHTPVVEATSTGTNASFVAYARGGVPCAVVSLPLAGMHSYNELIQLDDADGFIRLIQAIITSADIAAEFGGKHE